MSYQALLFCPDEQTARLVTQVLTELDFHVEPCNEPFAAVKKLTTQRFDAVVVDCDNEQNAGLLFKSARNSASNQSSLAVAVVDGQAGVAKAFRIGANLVLTKPINVDQAKGTLRVARGLLKKTEPGKGAAAPSAPVASAAPAASIRTTPVASAPPARTFTPAAPKTTFAPPVPKAPAAPPMAVAAASAEVEDEPFAESSIDEDMSVEPAMPQAPVPTKKFAPAPPSARSKEYPWQPASKPTGAMASSLKRAADVVAQAPSELSGAEESAPDYAAPEAHSVSSSAAAAAPARAKLPPRPVAKPVPPAARVEAKPKSAPVPTKLSITDPLAEEGVEVQEHASLSTPAPVAAPKLAAAPSGSGSKIGLIAAVAVVVLAAAGYFGWTKFHTNKAAGAQPASQVAAVAPAQVAPAEPAPNGTIETKPAPLETKHSAETPASANSAPAHTEKAPTKKSEPEKVAVNNKPEEKAEVEETASEPAPIVVKNGGDKTAAAPVQAPIQAPSPDALLSAPTGGSKAISGIVDSVGVVVPKSQTLKVSQAVMQSMIIKKVQPQYPYQAQRTRLHGTVQLEATIAKDGHVSNVKQTNGSDVLGRAAMDAVRQWRYKPYLLNGQPIEVQTQVSIDFKLP